MKYKKRPVSKKIDRKGKIFVENILDEMDFEVVPIHVEDDIGFDFAINFTVKRSVNNKVEDYYLPATMRVQLKSGDSYFKNETEEKFEIYIRENDIPMWRDSNTPVLLIVYKDSDKKAYWINIKKYIKNANYKGNGSLPVTVPKRNELTINSRADLLSILSEDQEGPFYQTLYLYEPIYDLLLGKYNNIDELSKYQETYENTVNSIYDKQNYDEEKIKLTIEFALSQRKLYSLNIAISNLEDLERILRNSKNINLNNFELYYYLCVLKLEKNQYKDSMNILKELVKLDPNFQNKEEFFVISALLLDGLGKVQEAVKYYDEVIRLQQGNELLLGLIYMFAGILLRKNDDYNKAETYLNCASIQFKNQPYFNAVNEANLGGLYSIWEKHNDAIEHYNNALELFKVEKNWHGMSQVYMNLGDVMSDRSINSKDSENKSWDYYRESTRLKYRNDFETVEYYKLNGLINYTNEIYSLVSEKSKKLSYNYAEGYDYLHNSEVLNERLGNLRGKHSVMNLSAISAYMFGKITDDSALLTHSLSNFIINSSRDGIKNVGLEGFSNIDDIRGILDWTYKIKGDRSALIGRIIFYKEFADFIPDKDIKKVFLILIKFEKLGYSFWGSHDYSRQSLEALKRFSSRLNKSQTLRIIKLVLSNLKNENNHFIIDSNIELLGALKFKNFNRNELTNVIDTTLHLIDKVNDNYDVYFLWQSIMSYNKSLINYVFSTIVKRHDNDENKISFNEYLAFSNSLFKNIRGKVLDKRLIDFFCNMLYEECKRESLNSYGGGGYDITKILGRLYKDVNKNLRGQIINCLLKYINCSNLVPFKRMQAVKSVSKIIHLDLKSAQELRIVLLRVVNNDFSNIKGRYLHDNDFTGNYFDYKILKAESLSCLVQIGFNNEKYIIKRFSLLFKDEVNPRTLDSIVITLGNLGLSILNLKASMNILEYVKNYLFQNLNHENIAICNWSIKFLSQIISPNESYRVDMLVLRLNQLKAKNNNTIRWVVANACKNLYIRNVPHSLLKDILRSLKQDLDYEVRKEAREVK